MTCLAGVSVVDATPRGPVAMSGFAARTSSSTDVHDPITVRAVAVDDSCVVVADVVGLDERTCAQIRSGAPFGEVVVAATHTHGGPAVMPGRLGTCDEHVRALVVDAGIRAAHDARRRRRPVRLERADAGCQPVATDRRRGGRPAAATLTGLRWVDEHGATVCWLVAYPCHPVVLGADNTSLTGDYPALLRQRLEAHGGVAVFLPGCAGDINVGHSASASYDTVADAARSFAEAERIGRLLADAIRSASWTPVPTDTGTRAARVAVELRQQSLDELSPQELAVTWAGRRTPVHDTWVEWAKLPDAGRPGTWTGSVTAFAWGRASLVFLPGEPFLEVGTAVAARSRADTCIVVGYTDGCPGYLPTRDAYADGGYEVVDAHRYYGQPAPFAAGSAELVVERAAGVLTDVEGTA